jgi:hypothetical protein
MTKQTTEPDVEAAWGRAKPISGRDPAMYRIAPDVIQSVIRHDRYNIRGEFGWSIECGRPVAFREITTESAIRALQHDIIGTGNRRIHPKTTGQSQR